MELKQTYKNCTSNACILMCLGYLQVDFLLVFFLSISSSIDLNLDCLFFGYLLKAKNDAAMNTSEFFINIKRY